MVNYLTMGGKGRERDVDMSKGDADFSIIGEGEVWGHFVQALIGNLTLCLLAKVFASEMVWGLKDCTSQLISSQRPAKKDKKVWRWKPWAYSPSQQIVEYMP